MADVIDQSVIEAPEEPAKKGRLALVAGLVGALALGGGGFYAVYSGAVDPMGLISGGGDGGNGGGGGHGDASASLSGVAFVPMDPIMISLPPGSSAKLLRFIGSLEVDPANAEEVTLLMPRVLDTLNTYLRAVDVRDLEQPSAIPRLHAQMLRRIQVVTGPDRVRDLLITEFILN
jgi:flagellar FliL protein